MTIRTSPAAVHDQGRAGGRPRILPWRVAARGFTAVEPGGLRPPRRALAAAPSTAGLVAPSGHAFLASESFVNPDGSGTTVPVPSPAEVFAAAKVLGMDTVIDPYTEPACAGVGRERPSRPRDC